MPSANDSVVDIGGDVFNAVMSQEAFVNKQQKDGVITWKQYYCRYKLVLGRERCDSEKETSGSTHRATTHLLQTLSKSQS